MRILACERDLSLLYLYVQVDSWCQVFTTCTVVLKEMEGTVRRVTSLPHPFLVDNHHQDTGLWRYMTLYNPDTFGSCLVTVTVFTRLEARASIY